MQIFLSAVAEFISLPPFNLFSYLLTYLLRQELIVQPACLRPALETRLTAAPSTLPALPPGAGVAPLFSKLPEQRYFLERSLRVSVSSGHLYMFISCLSPCDELLRFPGVWPSLVLQRGDSPAS